MGIFDKYSELLGKKEVKKKVVEKLRRIILLRFEKEQSFSHEIKQF